MINLLAIGNLLQNQLYRDYSPYTDEKEEELNGYRNHRLSLILPSNKRRIQ
jgi:hypothetical protein